MKYRTPLFVSLLLVIVAGNLLGQTPAKDQPISADRGPVGDLLRKWAAEGTAAGNVGDVYDNRDRGHSILDLKPYPQVQLFQYSEDELKDRIDWALATKVRPFVTFGNSSTAAMPGLGGSNARMATVSTAGFSLLYRQYRGNNIYMYPAHMDYKPGHDGNPQLCYGDLFPANTPYMIISHGSSHTDIPFMKAVPFTLAAFQPEVKQKLIKNGLLMPTIQMILRASGKQLKDPADYLTGLAHPVVFEGSNVDAEKMVRMAHDIDAGHLPPLAQIDLKEIPASVSARDYVDPFTEVIAATPCAVATVFRTCRYAQRFVLSGKPSADWNNLPLTYKWVLLQGDPAKVKINPLNKDGSDVEIIIAYHERAPSVAIPEIPSNRVDIALFVNNGKYYSPPAIFSNFSLDTEARTYDDKQRILEIGYSAGEASVHVNDWGKLLDQIVTGKPSAALKLLLARAGITDANFDALKKIGEQYKAENAKVAELDKAQRQADDDVRGSSQDKKLQAKLAAARSALDAGKQKRDDLLAQKIPQLDKSLQDLIEANLTAMMNEPTFYVDHTAELGAAPNYISGQMAAYGIIKHPVNGKIEIIPLLPGDKPLADRLSRYQKTWLAQLNGQVLAGQIPGVAAGFAANVADFNVTIRKPFRDVYRYNAAGQYLGITRYDGQKVTDFNTDGTMALERDNLGRCVKSQSVVYARHTPPGYDSNKGPDPTPLTFDPGKDFFHYEYADANDFVGKATPLPGL